MKTIIDIGKGRTLQIQPRLISEGVDLSIYMGLFNIGGAVLDRAQCEQIKAAMDLALQGVK